MHRLGLSQGRAVGSLAGRGPSFGRLRMLSAIASSDGKTPVSDVIPSLKSLQEEPTPPKERGSFFVDCVLPARYAKWDLRYYLSPVSARTMSNRVESLFSHITTHGFQVIRAEPTPKDGGVFLHFGYSPQNVDHRTALEEIEKEAKSAVAAQGGVPTWYTFGQGAFFRVRGKPWNEDMSRFPSPILKVEFEGPDVHQELLYEALRPYGRITDITRPQPVPAGTLRSATVTYARMHGAIVARNCLHGFTILDQTLSSSGATGSPTKTRLSISYERPIKVHAVRDWLTSHPRIVLPVLAFLVGTFTYTVFDPIREIFVRGKVMGWLDYRQWRTYQFIRKNAIEKLTFNVTSGLVAGGAASASPGSTSVGTPPPSEENVADSNQSGPIAPGPSEWKDRQEAEQSVHAYLSEMPSTVAILHGPQGSGKSKMIAHVLDVEDRKVLDIDCAEILKANTDSGLVSALAKETGYWPVFSFLASLNNMIDLAAMGLIGQKAGFSSSVDKELKQVLEVVGGALKQVSVDLMKDEKAMQARALKNRQQAARISNEKLGGMIESRSDDIPPLSVPSQWKEEDIDALPIVVIRNFAIKNAGGREILFTVLADWAAALVDNKVAHVIVLSDNRENMRPLAKALPARPLVSVALADADPASALAFVRGKMADIATFQSQRLGTLSNEDLTEIEKLGGRASDLDTLIHKVRYGTTIKDAVQDIIARGVGELRKTAFGDDAEDAKNLPWTREQVWSVLKQLAKDEEIPYADVLLEFPFKGEESALRSMEHAELISITTHDGLPISIRPGKPVYRYVFQRLSNEPVFSSVQDINYNQKAIAAEEKTIKACEEELVVLRTIGLDTGSTMFSFSTGAAASRASYLLSKMKTSQDKLDELERRNKSLKKVLSKVA